MVIKAQLCAIAQSANGQLTLVSPDVLHDLAPALESPPNTTIQPPTPQEQQQVEEWLKVKIQFATIKQEQQNRASQ